MYIHTRFTLQIYSIFSNHKILTMPMRKYQHFFHICSAQPPTGDAIYIRMYAVYTYICMYKYTHVYSSDNLYLRTKYTQSQLITNFLLFFLCLL